MLRSYLRLLLLFLTSVQSSSGKIVSAYVLPHGGIALNPSEFVAPLAQKEWAWKLHRAAVDVGKHINAVNPELILLSTPHGAADMHRFMFYLSGRGNGSAETENCGCPPCCYNLDIKMAGKYAEHLVADFMGLPGVPLNVSGLSFFGPPGEALQPAPLRWGEIIPLLFIKDASLAKVLVLSQPSRRYTQSAQMIPELLNLGKLLFHRLDALTERVVVIISADLAHTHDPDGPYGYSPAAEPFDSAIANWGRTLHPSYLLEIAPKYVDQAKSCGFTGIAMLHGMLDAGLLNSWIPVNHATYHPSYYGMMVASFERKQP